MNENLDNLADPEAFQDPIDLKKMSSEDCLDMLENMALIRFAEEQIAEMVVKGEVNCPCHFAIGQEATAVGVAYNLRSTDRGFGAHRSHSHFLASGGEINGLMSEVLGKSTGASKGMGGSMHLYGGDVGFAGSVPIVAGTVPLAVGAAMAAKMDGNGDVGIAYFGDGACEEGVVHESLNLASVKQLPVIFVVENNLFSSHLDIKLRQPNDRTARFGEAHSIQTEVVDGNDVVAVAEASGRLIERARRGDGPGFLEAVTYRWLGHVGPDANVDVGVRRSAKEIAEWKKRDPIRRLVDALIARGVSDKDVNSRKKSAFDRAIAARTQAYDQPFPDKSAILDYVYARPKDTQ